MSLKSDRLEIGLSVDDVGLVCGLRCHIHFFISFFRSYSTISTKTQLPFRVITRNGWLFLYAFYICVWKVMLICF